MRKRFVSVLMCALSLAIASSAAAQYIYLDVNSDGLNTPADTLTSASTGVDVWLSTNLNADGTSATCNVSAGALTLRAYEFFLRSTGSLTYGAWTDNLAFPTSFGNFAAGTDTYHGRCCGSVLAPGTYKLGRLTLTGVVDGATLSFLTGSSVNPPGFTSFGTACEGSDFDNTYKLGSDWFDADGVASAPNAPNLSAPDSVQSQEGALISVEAVVHGEPDGATPTIDAQGYPGSMALSVVPDGAGAARAVLSGRLGVNDAGTYTVIWSASQGASIESSDTTVVNIIDINFRPEVWAPAFASTQEGMQVTVNVSAEDPDDAITFLTANLSTLPSGHGAVFTASADNTQGMLSWTPSFSDAGTYTVTFTASNFMSGSDATTITVADVPVGILDIQLPGPGYRVECRFFSAVCSPAGAPCVAQTYFADAAGEVRIPLLSCDSSGQLRLVGSRADRLPCLDTCSVHCARPGTVPRPSPGIELRGSDHATHGPGGSMDRDFLRLLFSTPAILRAAFRNEPCVN